jgi:iron uptake system component EfeO
VCKPGGTGAGIGNAAFTVTESDALIELSADTQALVDIAATNYASYVRNEIDQLTTGTQEFATAYVAGDFDAARALYAPTRMHWERVETVAESFGDLDPKLDLREADLEEGQEWTGWHAIEKDLWPQDAEPGFQPYDQAKRERLAGLLVTDTLTLQTNVQDLSFDLPQLTNGAIGLLDEVATGKVTGEEEIWSHTDLWDFQANVDGAAVLYAGVRDILVKKNPELTAQLDEEFALLQELLNAQRLGNGFTYYNNLTSAQIKALADQVNALAEPLNKLTAAVVK